MTRSFCKDGWTIAFLGTLTACAPSSSSPNSNAGPDGGAANNEGASGSDGGLADGLAPASDGGRDSGDDTGYHADASSSLDASNGSDSDGGSMDAGTSSDAASDASAVVFLVPSWVGIFAIAVDTNNVYWTGEYPPGTSNTSVMSVPKGGGTPTVVYNSGGGGPGAIAIDDESVYFEQYTCCPIANLVVKAAKDGSTDAGAGLVLAGTTASTGISDIAIDSVNLYFVDSNGISSVPLNGGTQMTVVDPTGIFRHYDGRNKCLLCRGTNIRRNRQFQFAARIFRLVAECTRRRWHPGDPGSGPTECGR
jgi:hypothetical protein